MVPSKYVVFKYSNDVIKIGPPPGIGLYCSFYYNRNLKKTFFKRIKR